MRPVELEWYECLQAAQAGVGRQLAAMGQGLKHRYGMQGAGWDEHIEGAGGEMAVAKTLGLYWSASINTFKAPDIGAQIQVRTRSKHDFDLIVRDADADHEVFVLVTGRMPDFRVHGWLYGHEAKRAEWSKSYTVGRPNAYFVPQSALHPLDELPAVRGEGMA